MDLQRWFIETNLRDLSGSCQMDLDGLAIVP